MGAQKSLGVRFFPIQLYDSRYIKKKKKKKVLTQGNWALNHRKRRAIFSAIIHRRASRQKSLKLEQTKNSKCPEEAHVGQQNSS
jgi:hypothetical protein